MNVSDALADRYSVRGYKPDPVPEELIREVFDISRLAASGTNTQPWHIAVVSGDARDRLRDELCELFDAGTPPHVAFFSMPSNFVYPQAVDMGILLGSMMLVMVEKGMGCIAQGSLAGYPGPVKEIADIPEDNEILFGLSFGFIDDEAHINTVRMDRVPVDEIASFTS